MGETTWIAAATLCAGAALSWGIALIVARRATIPGARALVLLLAAVGIWKMARAGRWVASGVDAKVAWAKVEYLGIATVPLLLLLFTYAYCEQRRTPSRRTLALLWALPALTILLAATNEWHGLIWPNITQSGADPRARLIYSHGPWFWVTVVFSYAFLLISGVMVIRAAIRSPAFYRGQAAALLIGIALPSLTNALFLMGYSPFRGIDPTPLMLSIAGGVWFSSIIRRRLLDLIPVARETIIEQLEDGILVLDTQDRIVDGNAAARLLLGVGDAALIGRTLPALAAPPPLIAAVARHEPFHAELHLLEPPERYIEVRVTPLRGARAVIRGRLVQLRDITARKRAEAALHSAHDRLQAQLVTNERLQAQLREDAIRDALTECFNRRHLHETLAGDMERAAAAGMPVSIVLLDIDHFKQINDRCGHRAGDRVLQQVAAILRVQVRERGAVYRYGGEEFVVVLPGITPEAAQAYAEGWQQAMRVIALRDEDGAQTQITFSAGIAAFPDHGRSDEDLLLAADTALYGAKRGGRDRIVITHVRAAARSSLRLVV